MAASGKRAKSRAEGQRDCFGCNEGGYVSRWPLRADGDVPGPLRRISTAAHSPTTQTSILTLSTPYFAPSALWVGKLVYSTFVSSFFFSACTFTSASTSLSRHWSFRENGAKLRAHANLKRIKNKVIICTKEHTVSYRNPSDSVTNDKAKGHYRSPACLC